MFVSIFDLPEVKVEKSFFFVLPNLKIGLLPQLLHLYILELGLVGPYKRGHLSFGGNRRNLEVVGCLLLVIILTLILSVLLEPSFEEHGSPLSQSLWTHGVVIHFHLLDPGFENLFSSWSVGPLILVV